MFIKLVLPIVLVITLCWLQYILCFSRGGVVSIWRLNNQVIVAKRNLLHTQSVNRHLVLDIQDLSSGNAAIESRARSYLGMIKKDEIYYQIVDNRGK